MLTSSTTGTPTGSVSFLDGITLLGSAPLNNAGTATLPTSTLTAGAHSITTVYAGDSNFTGITSTVLTETIQDFQLSAAVSSDTISAGGSAQYTVQVTPTNGTTFPSAVLVAIAGLPAGAIGTITPSIITAGSGTASVNVTVQTAAQSQSRPGAHSAPLRESSTRFGGLATMAMVLGIVLPLPLLNRRRQRRAHSSLPQRKTLALSVLALILLVMLMTVGCGSGSTAPVGPQSYTMTLTGTGGALQHSTTLTLTVQ